MSPTPRAHPLRGEIAPPALDLDWDAALDQIAATETYLVATVQPDARPHVVPVLGVWVDDALTFQTSRTARKAHNLAANTAITVAAAGRDYDFTITGEADTVTDEPALQRIAAAFATKYDWWHPEVVDGQFVTDETRAPRAVFRVRPRHVYGFGKAFGFSATHWSFE